MIFTKEVDSTRLQDELKQVGLEPKYIETNGDQVNIVYDVVLTSEQEATVTSIVGAHQKTHEKTLEEKAVEYIDYGTNLYQSIKAKVWATNTYNKSIGVGLTIPDMLTLLSISDQLQKSLETGSLDTAKYVCGQLKISLPQYSSIADFAIASMTTYQAG